MYMPLVATEDGVPQFVKQPGVSLEAGDILGILTLDDPARVKHAKPFEGQLPQMGLPHVVGSKPHQRFDFYMDILNNILDGYDNQAMMASTLKDLLEVLRDPELPFAMVGAILATLSGRMPAKLEESVRSTIDSVRTKSVLEFPAQRIRKMIDIFIAENVAAQDQAMVHSKIVSLCDALDRFKNGVHAHEIATIAGLLERYENTEKLFGGSVETRVLDLREKNKNDLDKVAALVLSHLRTQSKSKLVLAILEVVKAGGSSFADKHLLEVLRNLASLEGRQVINRSAVTQY